CLFFRLLHSLILLFLFNATSPTEIYTLSLHDALPISVIHLTHCNSAGWAMSAASSSVSAQTTIIANILYGSLTYLEGLKFSLYVFNMGTPILGLIWPAKANPIPSWEAIVIPPSLDPNINNSVLKFLSGETLMFLYG